MAQVKIQILHDNAINTDDIYHKLEMLGYQTAKSQITHNIIETLDEQATDLVIMSIRFSSIYKETLAETIYNERGIPVIYLIPDDETEIPVSITKQACFGFIKLPCTNDHLKAVVEIALVRHQQEKRLKESESLYRTAIEQAGDGVSITRDGKRIFVNPQFLDIFGYDHPEEVIGTPIPKVVHPDDRALTLDYSRRRLRGEEVPSRYHIKGMKKNGDIVFVEVSSTKTRYQNNDVIVAYLRDITEQKKSEQERKKLEEQLSQAGKMEAIGTLAGGIAHEFNNVMSIITSNSELALDDIHEKDPVYGNLIAIQDACLRARDSVRQILTFSRQAGQELKPMKIAPAVRQSIEVIKPSLPDNIQIYEDFPLQSDYVNADPVLMHQVIENLCANAVHAMGENGGILTISLSGTELTAAMGARIIGLIPGSYAKLSISDTGYGMDPETRKRIFNPYFTTKETGKGTGIGLSVVHGIIANHGGAITVTSERGKGTTFDVFLPIAMSHPAAVTDINQIPRGCEKVLIVDDDEPIATAVKMVLKRLGYDSVAMTNPIKALDAFKTEPTAFDLVITDLAMPQMTGITFFRHIRNIRHNIPVIMCTGFSDKLNEDKAKEMGINAFILKPLVRRQLAETVRTVLDQEMDMEYDGIQFRVRESKIEYGLN